MDPGSLRRLSQCDRFQELALVCLTCDGQHVGYGLPIGRLPSRRVVDFFFQVFFWSIFGNFRRLLALSDDFWLVFGDYL